MGAMSEQAGAGGPPAPRFICDEMVKHLARWLRAAGYDTLVHEDGGSDRALLARALREGRFVVTCDRKLTEMRGAAGPVIVLRASALEGRVAELGAAVPLDWLYRPFTRCLLCNTPLLEADEGQRHRLPEGARGRPGLLRACPRCDKLYWVGGHARRMRARLEAWAADARLRTNKDLYPEAGRALP